MDETTASTNTTEDAPPVLPPDSPGSSVSSELQDEYEEILKYAVVIPSYQPQRAPKALSDSRGAFRQEQGAFLEEEPRQPPNPTAADRVRFVDDSSVPPAPCSSKENAIDDDVTSCHDDSEPRPCLVAMETVTKEKSVAKEGDYERMGAVLDDWSGELKRRVMAELTRLRADMTVEMHQQISAEKARHVSELSSMRDDVSELRQLLRTYETSLSRKDDVISNLTRTLDHEKRKREQQRAFSDWRIQAHDKKREEFCSLLAEEHYRRSLSRRVYYSWRSLIADKWRQRLEKACQARATEVCVTLTNQYEATIAQLELDLACIREELARCQQERDRYEQTMKKAFMRGVCALNTEAMAMFHENERREFRETLQNITGAGRQSPVKDSLLAPTKIVNAPPASGATSQAKNVHAYYAYNNTEAYFVPFAPKSSVAPSVKPVKPLSRDHKQLSRGGATVTLNPPMSSVVVERHQPVVKQTIAHALAAQYPRDEPTNQKPTNPAIQRPTTPTPSNSATNQHSPRVSSSNQRLVYKPIAGQVEQSKTISHVTSVKVGE